MLHVRKIADGLLLKPDAPDEFEELSRRSDGTIARATVRPVDDIVRVPDSGGPVALLGRRTADETPLYVLPGSAPGTEYSVRGDDYGGLDAALTDGRDGPLTLSALARATSLNKPDAPGRTATVIHRGGDGVAVLVRGLEPAGIVFASGEAAIGSTHADVIGTGIPGQDPAQAPLGAAYVADDDWDVARRRGRSGDPAARDRDRQADAAQERIVRPHLGARPCGLRRPARRECARLPRRRDRDPGRRAGHLTAIVFEVDGSRVSH